MGLLRGMGVGAEIQRLPPGTVLIAFGIRQAIAMGIHEFDFGDSAKNTRSIR